MLLVVELTVVAMAMGMEMEMEMEMEMGDGPERDVVRIQEAALTSQYLATLALLVPRFLALCVPRR